MQFEKDLKTLLLYRNAHPQGSINIRAVGIPRMNAEALHGFGLICNVSEDMAGNYTCSLAPSAYSYFENKRLSRRAFWREFFSKFLGGVLTGVVTTLAVTYLTGHLQF